MKKEKHISQPMWRKKEIVCFGYPMFHTSLELRIYEKILKGIFPSLKG